MEFRRVLFRSDFASVYLALLEGTDPTPIDPIVTLKKAAVG